MLPGDQDVRTRGTYAGDQLQDRPHCGRFSDECRPALRAQQSVLCFQTATALQAAPQIDLCMKYGQKSLIVPRFLDKIPRSAPHRLHSQIEISPGAHHYNGKICVQLLDGSEQVKTFLA